MKSENKNNTISEILGLKAIRCDLYEQRDRTNMLIIENIEKTRHFGQILQQIQNEEKEMSRIAQRIDGTDIKLKEERERKLKEEKDRIKSQLPTVKDLPPPVEKKSEPPKEPESVKEPDVETTEETI